MKNKEHFLVYSKKLLCQFSKFKLQSSNNFDAGAGNFSIGIKEFSEFNSKMKKPADFLQPPSTNSFTIKLLAFLPNFFWLPYSVSLRKS